MCAIYNRGPNDIDFKIINAITISGIINTHPQFQARSRDRGKVSL